MKKCKKWIAGLLAAGLMTVLASATALADGTIVTGVSLSVTINIEPGCARGDEEVRVANSSGGKYQVTSYELKNAVETWSESDSPSLEITLTAEEGYTFDNIKAGDVTLYGTDLTLGLVSRQNDAKNLVLTVNKPPLAQTMPEVRNLRWSRVGVAAWDPISSASSYEVRLYRGGQRLGQAVTVTGTSYDFSKKVAQEGGYSFQVRAVSAAHPEVKGEYVTSPVCTVDTNLAAAIKKGPTWERNELGWWYRYPDGTYPAGTWLEIGGKWYYFDERGYMLENTTTPDGYRVDENGVMVENGE